MPKSQDQVHYIRDPPTVGFRAVYILGTCAVAKGCRPRQMAIPQKSVGQVLDYVYPRIEEHTKQQTNKPFILGLSGLQGSGKSTWAESIADALWKQKSFNVVVLSLDDLYHTHDNLVKTREADSSNGLLQTRGQPGTHDEDLAHWFFDQLKASPGSEIQIPSFDKSKFNGEGDRASQEQWTKIKLPVDVLIFEGWCMAFTAISESELKAKWAEAEKSAADDLPDGFSTNTLARHSIEHLKKVNENLKRYNDTFMTPQTLDYLIHLDTDTLANVYRWRLDQEHALWQKRGSGMSDEAVVKFVQGYMPAYELYLDHLKQEAFPRRKDNHPTHGTQLRVLLGEDRNILNIQEL